MTEQLKVPRDCLEKLDAQVRFLAQLAYQDDIQCVQEGFGAMVDISVTDGFIRDSIAKIYG